MRCLDSGSGYSWTTEWLYKAGVEAIGIDICRTYLEIGIERMGTDRPADFRCQAIVREL